MEGRIFTRIAFVIAAAAVVIVSVTPATRTARAQPPEDPAGARCTIGMVKGSYGARFQGESLRLGRYASVSLFTFDGKGRFSASERFSAEGVIDERSFSGSYSVDANCRATLSFPSELGGQPHTAFGACVVVDRGKEIFCLDNAEGWRDRRAEARLAA